MKKKLSIKELSFNKEIISNLSQIKGGYDYTDGCTDGCTGSSLGSSSYHCTLAVCTNDCMGPSTMCVCKSRDGGTRGC